MRFLSLSISSLLHPAFVPLLGFLLIYMLGGYAIYMPNQLFWFTVILLIEFTIVIPIAAVYFLYWRKIISSIELDKREERAWPLVINLVSYAIVFFIFSYYPFPKILVNYTAVTAIIAGFALVVSLNYKISLHALSWGSLVGVIYAYSLQFGIELHHIVVILILVSSIVAASRLLLDAHRWDEIYSAWLSAAFMSYLGMTYL